MANKKISELTDAGTITTSDEIPLARGGRTYKAKIGLSIVPTGCVMAFAGSTIPEGWLKCNGEAIPNAQGTVQNKTANFSTLYSIIGANLPDLRGYFVRGLDDGRKIDEGRQLRTSQDDALKTHTHTTNPILDFYGGRAADGPWNGQQQPRNITDGASSSGPSTGASTETRPKNVALHYIIKY